jgi:4-hydroxy-3-polyprenylbenzoate decarboxylase
VLPGVREVHAVDAAGVHPLLLAVGSERYTPYAKPTRPQELLTQANAILGQGQMSLAKYLFIADGTYHPELEAHDIQPFMHWMWERLDFESGLHFQTRTTIDTLDYSGEGLNRGSKVIFAASGQPRRTLRTALPDLGSLQSNIADARLCMAGVLAIEAKLEATLDQLMTMLHAVDKTTWEGIACVVLVDDAEFTARNLNNFLWVTFTRSNPATDIRGIGERIEDKHWCCSGPIVIDARRKPHHAPPLIEDPETTLRIDALAARGGPLSKFL